MVKEIINLTPRALNKDNIRDFSFLVPNDVVDDILSDDGTSGFAVLSSVKNSPPKYVGALCGRFVTRVEYAITSIYVSKENRRQGVGTFLLDTLYGILEGMDAQIDIRVIRNNKEAAGLISFLEKNGFEEYFSEDERVYVIDFANASRVKLPAPSKKLSIEPFGRIPKNIIRSFESEQKNGFVPIPRSGFEGQNIDRDLSMAIVSKDRIEGFCIVEDYLEKCPIISALWVEKSAPESHFVSLISAVRDEAIYKYDMDALIFMPVVNDKMADTIERIFPEKALKEGMMHYRRKGDFLKYESKNDYFKGKTPV